MSFLEQTKLPFEALFNFGAAVGFLEKQQVQIERDARLKKDKIDARRQALEALCLVLLNTDEFAYAN